MGTKYGSVSVENYNATPPPDNGAAIDGNSLKWDDIVRAKLTDPLDTAIAAVDSALVDMFNVGPTAKSASYTTVLADYNTVLEVTNTVTITLLAASSGGAGYYVTVKNAGTGTVTVASADTIDGAGSYKLDAGESSLFIVNSAGTAYLKVGASSPSAAWVQVGDTQTAASDPTLDFTGLDTSYIMHRFVLDSVTPATAGALFAMRIYRNSILFTSANYQWHSTVTSQDANTYAGAASGGIEDTWWGLSAAEVKDGAFDGWTGEITVINPGLVTTGYNAHWQGSYINTVGAGEMRSITGAGRTTVGGGDIQNGARFLFSSGNIATGNITLYGLV